MTNFEGFSRAAILYAENAPIVAAVQKVFEQEVGRYLDTLASLVRAEIQPLPLRDIPGLAYRYWWIGLENAKNEDRDWHLHLWLKCKEPEIVSPGRLRLHVDGAKVASEKKFRAAALSRMPGISEYCKSITGPWSFLDIEFELGDDSRLPQVAKAVAGVLRELHKIMQEEDSKEPTAAT